MGAERVATAAADLTSPADVERLAALLTQALLPRLARPGGRIVAIGSIAALRGPGSYSGAKAALHAWALGLAQSLAADGVTVNVVAPGFVPGTEFWADRLTDEVAAAVAHLTSAEAG